MKRTPIRRRVQRGITAIEVALTLPFALAFLFGIMEMARAMYMWNTLTQISRSYAHGLAVTDFNDAGALAAARTRATFGNADGSFPLSGAINGSHFQVRYLRADGSTEVSALPECPPQNIVNCTRDPEGASCIRFVQVRLCQPGSGSSCDRVPYDLWLPTFLPDVSLSALSFPSFATLVPVDGFGHIPGTSDSCP
jgi:hypothetical protein